MSEQNDSPDVIRARSEVEALSAEITEAEELLSEHQADLAEAKEMLSMVLAETRTSQNADQLKASEAAWRASIVAYEFSIDAYTGLIAECSAEIDEILKGTPGARRLH